MRGRAGVILTAAVWLVASGLRTDVAAQAAARNVLTLHLASETFPSNPILDAGIREAFAAHPETRIAYYAEYLEADLFPSADATRAFKEYLRAKYADRRVDVVI